MRHLKVVFGRADHRFPWSADGARKAAHNFAKDILISIFGLSPSGPTNGREIIWVRNLLPSANLNLERLQ